MLKNPYIFLRARWTTTFENSHQFKNIYIYEPNKLALILKYGTYNLVMMSDLSTVHLHFRGYDSGQNIL
jgi:hypothetical protein